MDLTVYYQKIRDEQTKITDEFPVVVSLETQDGGKAGVRTEVPRAVAARMFVDGLARPATATEAKTFRDAKAEAKRQADEAEAASKVEFNIVPKKG
jgi:hypothetical protein